MNLIQRISRKIEYIKWRRNDERRISEICDLSKTDVKQIYLLGTPEYLNYGDHLIAAAEKNFLNEKFPSYNVIEITKELLILHFEEVVQYIKDTDIIAITGGGFLGDLYQDMETLIESILERFHNNSIVFFPATIYLSQEVQESNCEHELFRKLNKLKNAIFFAREMNTYSLLQDKCSNTNVGIHFSPDIALYYKYDAKMLSKNRVGICIRKDKESIVQFDDNYLKVLSDKKIEFFSTVKSYSFLSPKGQMNIIDDFLDMVASYDIVITDRLHCMIMCYITNTPCIVFDNLTRKISGVFAWIEQSTFIRIVNSYDEFVRTAEKFLSSKCSLEDDSKLDNKFSMMAQQIEQKINCKAIKEDNER